MKKEKLKNIFVEGAIPASLVADSIQKHNSMTDIGGHSIFLGQVRADTHDGKGTVAIEYTAFEELALEKMYEIRESIFAKYPIKCMHIHHSLGKVLAGEICLLVFTSSSHREAAISACTELVELIKGELPIWGKELFENNSYQWKVNK